MRAVLVVVLLGALVSFGIVAPAAQAAVSTDTELAVQQILADTNAVRAELGLQPLIRNSAMDSVAQAWSQTQANNGTMSHNPAYPSQIPSGWTRAGENVATGYSYTTVVSAWKASPGHYANMTADYTDIGIGYVEKDGKRYYTQDFARYSQPDPDPLPAPDASPTIAQLYASLGGAAGPLGAATSGVAAFSDAGGGSLQHFANGSIYASNIGGTHVVWAGAIREIYWGANSIFGPLDWPAGDQDCTAGPCTQSFLGGTVTPLPVAVTTTPAITGNARVGGTLTVSTGTYSPTATIFSYTWYRNGVEISGATARTYVPVAADFGTFLTAEVTARANLRAPLVTMSAPTAAIGPEIPTIAQMYAASGGASGPLGAATSAAVAFPNNGGGTLQHFANGSIYSSNLGGTWIVMGGPIRDQYWAASSISGIYKWPTGAQTCAMGTCSQTFIGDTITATPLTVLTPPTIGGAARVGATVVANPGTYNPVAQAYTYAWFRNGVRVPGASASYVLTAADLGATLEVEVTAGRSGSVAVTTRSAPTAAIGPSAASQIAALAAANPGLGAATSGVVAFRDSGGGSLQHYQGGSIYASNSYGAFLVWAGPIRDAYWAASSIFGVYKWPTGAQTCGGGSCSQTFVGGTLTAAPLAVLTPPTIGGPARVGGTLVANPGTYNPVAQAYTYAWFRNGVRVAGASASYVLTAADEGKTLEVEVTAGRSGSVAVTTRSAPSATIGPSAASAIAAARTANPALGSSTTGVVAFPDSGGGSLQHYQNGSIYSSNNYGTFVVWTGQIRTAYWAANSIFGVYKWPTGARTDCSGGSCTQTFVGGTITGIG